MKKPRFAEGNIYHIFNRGVEKRKIFLDDQDYLRFIHCLWEFNSTEPTTPSNQRFKIAYPAKIDRHRLSQSLESLEVKPPKVGKPIVDILLFTLMPNHFHLLLREIRTGGIIKFMQKLGTGYTMYFNQKQKRVGGLFQGTYKAVAIARDVHFLHIPFYIHANPLDLAFPTWRKMEINDYRKAMQFLEQYRWSSFPDYIGKKNFPSLTKRNFLLEFYNGTKNYRDSFLEWLRNLNEGDTFDFKTLLEV